MTNKPKKSGFSLIELMIVMGIIAVMGTIAMVSAPSMIRSQKMSSAQNLINAALAQAQAYAAKEQKYAGVRFQPGLNDTQYLIIVEKEDFNSTIYTAIPNSKPAALPGGIGVISSEINGVALDTFPKKNDYLDDDQTNNQDGDASNDLRFCLNGARVFTIIFSPSGNLVTKPVTVLSRDITTDKIFNTDANVTAGNALFHYDTYPPDPAVPASWCIPESSTAGLYIYEINEMDDVDSGLRYSEYLADHVANQGIEQVTINIYTGGIIDFDE